MTIFFNGRLKTGSLSEIERLNKEASQGPLIDAGAIRKVEERARKARQLSNAMGVD